MAANNKQIAGKHYKEMGIEPWDVIDTWPIEQRIGAYRANALKYLMRMGSKDEQLQEVLKAGHYIEKLVECLTTKTEVRNVKLSSTTLEEAYEEQYRFDQMRGTL